MSRTALRSSSPSAPLTNKFKKYNRENRQASAKEKIGPRGQYPKEEEVNTRQGIGQDHESHCRSLVLREVACYSTGLKQSLDKTTWTSLVQLKCICT